MHDRERRRRGVEDVEDDRIGAEADRRLRLVAAASDLAGIGEQQHDRRPGDRQRVAGDEQLAQLRRVDPPVGIGEQHMHEDGEVEAREEHAERVQQRRVRGGQDAEEEREADRRHQHAEAVVGPAPPGEQAGADERPADEQAEHRGQAAIADVVGRQHDRQGDDADDDALDRDEPERAPQSGHEPSSSCTRSPESSALGTKPHAPEVVTSGPKSEPSRLEVMITVGCSA